MEPRSEKKRTFADVITAEEYELLCLPEVREAVHRARGRDPLEVAMDRRVPHARLVATQVKYLARAEEKLPSYAAAECILPPRAFEQASSEACAAHKRIEGDTVLDLTCGLGVDALYLSRRFRRVVALERDPVLARITACNLARMGVANVEVVHAAAEEFLRREGLRFDWIYADPDRRSEKGLKQVRLEACSPDVLALRPLLRRAAPRLCLKNSPLFDVDEALRLFPRSCVEVVSLGDECKEVMVYDDASGPRVIATALGRGSFEAAGEVQRVAGEAFTQADAALAAQVEPLEETVDRMCDVMREEHITRLKAGECGIEPGLLFLDVLTNTERISDHCSNIAARLIGDETDDPDMHARKRTLLAGQDAAFNARLATYEQKYLAPLTK